MSLTWFELRSFLLVLGFCIIAGQILHLFVKRMHSVGRLEQTISLQPLLHLGYNSHSISQSSNRESGRTDDVLYALSLLCQLLCAGSNRLREARFRQAVHVQATRQRMLQHTTGTRVSYAKASKTQMRTSRKETCCLSASK